LLVQEPLHGRGDGLRRHPEAAENYERSRVTGTQRFPERLESKWQVRGVELRERRRHIHRV